jgi:hypothetical protein
MLMERQYLYEKSLEEETPLKISQTSLELCTFLLLSNIFKTNNLKPPMALNCTLFNGHKIETPIAV